MSKPCAAKPLDGTPRDLRASRRSSRRAPGSRAAPSGSRSGRPPRRADPRRTSRCRAGAGPSPREASSHGRRRFRHADPCASCKDTQGSTGASRTRPRMTRTKKYAPRIRVSTGVMTRSRSRGKPQASHYSVRRCRANVPEPAMNLPTVRELLRQVQRGAVEVADAEQRLLAVPPRTPVRGPRASRGSTTTARSGRASRK